MEKRLVSGLVFVSAVGIAACSSNAAPAPSEESCAVAQGIQGGRTDTTNTFVVGIASTAGHLCSGALIAPNLVLTARHCVAQSPARIDCQTAKFGALRSATSMYVTTNPSLRNPGGSGWYQASKIRVPTESEVCGTDIALIVLRTSIPASVAKPITPSVQHPVTDRQRYGSKVAAIGYGDDGAGNAGVRRIKEDIDVLCFPGDPTLGCGSRITQSVTTKEFITGAGTCQGDSGSSAIEQKSLEANAPISLGVLSRGGEDANGNCLQAVYTRVDSWKDLIVTTALEAAQDGNYAAPGWTKSEGGQGPTSGEKKALGEVCADASECDTDACASPDDRDTMCTQACDEENACPDGFACTDGQCFAPPAKVEEAQPTTTTTTNAATDSGTRNAGCAVGDMSPRTEYGWGLGLFAALGLRSMRKRSRKA